MNTNYQKTEDVLGFIRQLNPTSSLVPIRIGEKTYLPKMVNESASQFLKNLQNGSIVKQSDKPIVGVRTFDGKTLPKGVFHVITKVRLTVDTSLADNATPVEADLATLSFANNATAGLKHSEFRILQNGELLRGTVSVFQNSKASTSNDDDFVELIKPIVLREQTTFDFNIKTPDGYATTNKAIRVEYIAWEFVEASNAN